MGHNGSLGIGYGDQLVAQLGGTPLGDAERPLTILAFVVLCVGIHVRLPVPQHGVNDAGQLVGRGGDGLGRSQVGFLPAQEGAQGGWRLDRAAQGVGCSPSAQHVGIVNAVAASSADATRVMTLSPVLARPGASPRSQVLLYQLGQAEASGQGGG